MTEEVAHTDEWIRGQTLCERDGAQNMLALTFGEPRDDLKHTPRILWAVSRFAVEDETDKVWLSPKQVYGAKDDLREATLVPARDLTGHGEVSDPGLEVAARDGHQAADLFGV